MFLALSFSRLDGESTLPPTAANADRWAVLFKRQIEYLDLFMTVKRTSLVFLSLAIFGTIISFAYSWVKEITSPPNYEFTPEYSPANFEAELEKNRTKWESQRITHYQISLDPSFFSDNYGHTPYVIEVKDGEVVAVVDALGNRVSIEDTQSFAYPERELFTIPGLFTYVHQIFLAEPPMIRVTYDSTYGYPDSIFVDPYIEPCCQEYWIDVLEFRVLP
jgi:hypothetical protein